METDWRREFAELLSSPEAADWEKAQQLKQSRVPAELFRYRAPSDRSFAALERNTIWLSSADQFNDLHDTSVAVDGERSVESLLREGVDAGKLNLPGGLEAFLPPIAKDVIGAFDAMLAAEVAKQVGPEIAKRAKDFFRNFAARQGEEMSARISKFMQRATKVACFSEADNIQLQWAHYAESHRGFCIGYSFAGLPPDDLRARWLAPVVYASERFNLWPLMWRLRGKPNPFVPTLAAIHKSLDWAYEREWRIVAPIGDDAIGREWKMPTPSRVVLAHRMAAADRAKVVSIARGHAIPVYEVVPSGDGFKLDSRPLVDS